MNKKILIIYCILMAIFGGVLGVEFAKRDHKIEQLQKENEKLNQEIIDYRWQIAQVPYIIESWCNGE